MWERPSARQIGMAAVLFSALFGYGCKRQGEPGNPESENSAVAVQAAHPTIGPISEEIAADAILAPVSQAALSPRISAPITAEYVQRGARVTKGQLLMTLEHRDLTGSALDSKGSYVQAEAAYTAATKASIPEDVQRAQLEVTQAKANLDVANRTKEERKRLFREGAIAGRDADSAVAAAVQAQATYDTATEHLANLQGTTRRTSTEAVQGQLTSARGRLVSAEAQVGYAQLRSPINGIVTDRPLFQGEAATAGAPAITIMDTSSLLAKLHLAQPAAQKLRLGGAAELHVPGVESAQAATIAFISPVLDPGSTTVEVWLKLSNADGHYKVGTPVHAILRGYTVPGAIQVPPAAILPSADGITSVMVIGPDGKAHRRTVKVGLRTAGSVQLLEGVSAIDEVITDGSYGLDDGARVTVGNKGETP